MAAQLCMDEVQFFLKKKSTLGKLEKFLGIVYLVCMQDHSKFDPSSFCGMEM